MKRFLPFTLILLAILASACTRSLTQGPPTLPPTEIVLPTLTDTLAATETPAATETLEATETPSQTPEETGDSEPTETATQTPTPTAPPFDPDTAYGSPTLFDPFNDDRNWVGSGGTLPDTDFIRLALGGGKMHVTGKPVGWDTWWFTFQTAGDQFLEMTVETGNCSGKQAYGLIVRGPSTNTTARGYIVTFSCDGAYRLDRLDSSSPYTKVELIPWTEADSINAGSNETNILGIELSGDTIILYANRFKLEEIEDGTFSSGRFGVFVNADAPGNFTYSVDELSFWNFD
jgi:hypothetical protein